MGEAVAENREKRRGKRRAGKGGREEEAGEAVAENREKQRGKTQSNIRQETNRRTEKHSGRMRDAAGIIVSTELVNQVMKKCGWAGDVSLDFRQ